MKTVSRFCPFWLAIAPILFLAGHNSDQVQLRYVLAALAISLGGTAVCWTAAWFVYRDRQRSAAVTAVGIVLFFSYGRAFDLLRERGVLVATASLHWVLGATSLGAFLSAAAWFARARRSPERLLQVLGTAALAISILGGGRLAKAIALNRLPSHGAARPPETAARPPIVLEDHAGLPDVYYIILDGYTRADLLQEVYGHDNSDFIGYLKAKGFFVADASTSNYAMTFLSLASSLNMRYLDDDVRALGRGEGGREHFYRLIDDSEVALSLQAKGYRYVHFNSNYSGSESSIADMSYSAVPALVRSEWMSALIRSTMLRELAPHVAQTHLFTFETLKTVPAIRGPTFAFVHFLLPHNPYVFDREGNIRANVPLALQFEHTTGGWENRRGYVDQLVFLNTKMREIVDHLIAASSVPPVIILQADHGSAASKDHNLPERSQPDFLRERMSILNAYYGPEEFTRRLYSTISPVNTFRLLFAACFGEPHGPLPDRQYFSWYSDPYDLADVTDEVHPAEKGVRNL